MGRTGVNVSCLEMADHPVEVVVDDMVTVGYHQGVSLSIYAIAISTEQAGLEDLLP